LAGFSIKLKKKKKKKWNRQLHILIVKLSSIGDVVHALPCVSAIKRALPEAKVSWVVEKRAAEILRDNPQIHRLIEIETRGLRKAKSFSESFRAISGQVRLMRSEGYSVALDLQGLLKSSLIARLSGAQSVIGFSSESLREPLAGHLLSRQFKVAPNLHVIQKNLELVSQAVSIPVQCRAEELEFSIHIPEAARAEAESVKDLVGDRYAILNPGGGWPTKLWDSDRFGKLAQAIYRRFDLPSVVTYGPGEEGIAEKVRLSSEGSAFPFRLSIKGFFAAAERAAIYVGGDTGPTHLAVAARTPVVGLFGPTEWWRNGSLNSGDICIERNDIDCRTGCHRRSCSKWICMDMNVEMVFRAIEERLVNIRDAATANR
jgi:heptosyltransferase I